MEARMITANPSTYRVFVIGTLGAMLLLTASGWGQATINAQVTGGGGSGKCTFEVRVDGVADVQIRANQGYLQTKAGMPAQWVRLKCNQPLPRNPNNFRFAGVDGRGKQYLLRNPAQNNGIAVVRIEDNRSGYEGYTGDIMWNGGNNNGNPWNGGWWSDNWNGGGSWNGGGGGFPPPGWRQLEQQPHPELPEQHSQQGATTDQQCAGEFHRRTQSQSGGIVRDGGRHGERS